MPNITVPFPHKDSNQYNGDTVHGVKSTDGLLLFQTAPTTCSEVEAVVACWLFNILEPRRSEYS